MKRFIYHCSEIEFWRALRYVAARNDWRLSETKHGFSISWQWKTDYRAFIYDRGKLRFFGKVWAVQDEVLVSMRLRSPLWIYWGAIISPVLIGIISKSLFGFFACAVVCILYLTGEHRLQKRLFHRRNQKIIRIFSSLEDVMQEGNLQK